MDLQVSLRKNSYSEEGLEITCTPGEIFFVDITTSNNADPAMKDFFIAFGKANAGVFSTFYSYVLKNQSIPSGAAITTIVCQASGAGSYDCIGGIGSYNSQTGEFTIEDMLTALDCLHIAGVSITDAYIAEPLGCTNPLGNESQIDQCGAGYGGQPLTDHIYQCINGIWTDQGYNPNCVAPSATITMEDANIPIGNSDIASILITNISNLGSVDAHVLYDPNIVSVKAVGGGDFDWLLPTDDYNGTLTLMAYTTGSINGNCVLCDITFEPASGASVNNTCPLALSGTQLLDATPQGIPIPHNVIDGIATIIASGKMKQW